MLEDDSPYFDTIDLYVEMNKLNHEEETRDACTPLAGGSGELQGAARRVYATHRKREWSCSVRQQPHTQGARMEASYSVGRNHVRMRVRHSPEEEVASCKQLGLRI